MCADLYPCYELVFMQTLKCDHFLSLAGYLLFHKGVEILKISGERSDPPFHVPNQHCQTTCSCAYKSTQTFKEIIHKYICS